MITTEAIVTAARRYIGTPWHHDARVRGVGIDCVGLIVGTLSDLGLPVEDFRGYSRDADLFPELEYRIGKIAKRIEDGEPANGDILLFRARLMFNHCGFRSEEGLIHAYSSPSVMAVVEQPFEDSWRRRLHSFYRLTV